MNATSDEYTTIDGFEISVDEAAYLVERLDLAGLLPEVLALYNPMTGPDLAGQWKALQDSRLTDRGILTAHGVLSDVARLVETIAYSEETLAIRVIPLHQPNVMLRIALGTRFGRYVAASRTRDMFLAQRVPAADWVTAATAVLTAVLGTPAPAPLSEQVQLTTADAARLIEASPSQVEQLLLEYGLTAHDAAILNAASSPDVVTEFTALRRVDGITRRTKTAVSLLDTEKYGRVVAWSYVGPDKQSRLTYAPMSTSRLETALRALFDSLG